MTNTQEPQISIAAAQVMLKPYASQVAKIKAAFRIVAAQQTIPEELKGAIKVMKESEYIRWSTRAQRYMLTEKGRNFARQIRKFG